MKILDEYRDFAESLAVQLALLEDKTIDKHSELDMKLKEKEVVLFGKDPTKYPKDVLRISIRSHTSLDHYIAQQIKRINNN